MIHIFINVIVPVMIILISGFILGSLFKENTRILSTLAIYIFSPALVFRSLIRNASLFSADSLYAFIAVSIVVWTIFLTGEILKKTKRINPQWIALTTVSVMLPNTGNLGIPVSMFAFGEEAVSVATIYLVYFMLYTHTLGVYAVSSVSEKKENGFLRIIKLPVIYAALAAVILNFFEVSIPSFLWKPVDQLGQSAITVNLILIGINIASLKLSKNIPVMLLISSIKLIAVPLFGLSVLSLFGVNEMYKDIGLLQMAMPSAVYSSILCSHFNVKKEEASGLVILSVLMSLISLTVIISLL